MKMNKRGDIPVTILVLGVVAICILAILSFVNLSNKIENDFLGIGLIETMNSIEEELKFYGETGFEGDYGNVFERRNVKINIEGNSVKEGRYSVTERNFPNIFTISEKSLVRVEYKK